MNLNNVKLALNNLQQHVDASRSMFNTSWLDNVRDELVDVIKLDAELNKEFEICKLKFENFTEEKSYLDYSLDMLLAEFAANGARYNNVAISESDASEASLSEILGKITEMRSEINFLEICQSITE